MHRGFSVDSLWCSCHLETGVISGNAVGFSTRVITSPFKSTSITESAASDRFPCQLGSEVHWTIDFPYTGEVILSGDVVATAGYPALQIRWHSTDEVLAFLATATTALVPSATGQEGEITSIFEDENESSRESGKISPGTIAGIVGCMCYSRCFCDCSGGRGDLAVSEQ